MTSKPQSASSGVGPDQAIEPAGDGGLEAARPGVLVRALTKEFRNGRATTRAIDGVDIDVGAGELVCIVGASGCGKSTLLNIIGGLDHATSGSVTVGGQTVVGPGPDRGMVFQAYSLFPWKSVADNIGFGLELAGMGRVEREARIAELVGIMGLAEHVERKPRELSGGMRQRVAIARALAPEPDVLLLDEPFGALDAQTKRAMQDFLLTVWQRTSATVLMVTHDVAEAVYLAERIYVMTPHPGRVAEVVTVPFGRNRGPTTKRDQRFVDLVDEVEDLVVTTTLETGEGERP